MSETEILTQVLPPELRQMQEVTDPTQLSYGYRNRPGATEFASRVDLSSIEAELEDRPATITGRHRMAAPGAREYEFDLGAKTLSTVGMIVNETRVILRLVPSD